MNHYTYCCNNPEAYIDLTGLFLTTLIGGFVGAVVGTVGGVISELTDDKPGINWRNVAIDAGAVVGAIVGTVPLTAPALLGTGATAGAVNYGVKTTYNDEWGTKSIGEHIVDLGINAVGWSIGTLIGGSVAPAEVSASIFVTSFTAREIAEFTAYETIVLGTQSIFGGLIGAVPGLIKNLATHTSNLLKENNSETCPNE